jgi:molybdate transport system substrate-binding protein
MNLRTIHAALCWLFLLLALPLQGQPSNRNLSIAAAGDLRGTLEDVKAAFEAKHTNLSLQLSFGSSGSLTAQIQQGAPFDVFLSADAGYPEQLVQTGFASAENAFPYAMGFLVLWVHKDIKVNLEKEGLKTLLNPHIKRIATANPRTAPYGRAGESALRQAGLYDALQARLVFADNIAQAAQFLQTGAAEAGLISRSQAQHPLLMKQGSLWILPTGCYPPLKQVGLILKRSRLEEEARCFRDFLLSSAGQSILANHGFGKP